MHKFKSFSVFGLFGTDDVHIPFDENIKILVGENGVGKTQVLNLFYYTLTRNFFKLTEFNFERLLLEFNDAKPIEIKKSELDVLIKDMFNHPMVKEIIEDIGYSQFELLRNKFINFKGDWRRLEEQNRYYEKNRKIPIRHIFRVFDEIGISKNKKPNDLFQNHEHEIDLGLNGCDIMYFPTYRRVEEDLHNLGYDDEDLVNQENTLIQFGMDDVQRRFYQIESTIDKLIKDGFSNFSTELVNQFFKDEDEPEVISTNDYLKNIDKNDIEILLSRIGDKISDSKKEKIKEIVLNNETQNKDNSLNLLLKKLIENYSPQKQLDNSVKAFRDICNDYLVNKKIFYDESAIKIFVKSDRNGSTIPLNKLSSGEKQIISMFSKVYLSDTKKRFIVLFDEPELSLSMKWQKQLLPNIVNSGKCEFLLAVTHSPFIFANEFDLNAISITEYITPRTPENLVINGI